MNMYTNPEYRRQGIAIHTLDLLVKDARARDIDTLCQAGSPICAFTRANGGLVLFCHREKK